jgi:hypothetical protein
VPLLWGDVPEIMAVRKGFSDPRNLRCDLSVRGRVCDESGAVEEFTAGNTSRVGLRLPHTENQAPA